ncbi:MAG: DUF86 domain-containing protein [Candidatus Brocadiaceae bacterium]|jgi:uncharacterized protein with HEPN domain
MGRDSHYLTLMNQSMAHIMHYARAGRTAFMDSRRLQHATLWNVYLVSVAARHLSDGLRRGHPEVDWDHVCALARDVVQDPWDFDRSQVWGCIQEELPELRRTLKRIINEAHRK